MAESLKAPLYVVSSPFARLLGYSLINQIAAGQLGVKAVEVKRILSIVFIIVTR